MVRHNMNELISLSELADKMGMFATNLRRYAIRHGFQFVRARMLTGGRGRQPVIVQDGEGARAPPLRNEGAPPTSPLRRSGASAPTVSPQTQMTFTSAPHSSFDVLTLSCIRPHPCAPWTPVRAVGAGVGALLT